MSETKPLLIVFAGPNGSGKSTVTEAIRRYAEDFPSAYINADDIARNLGMGIYEAAAEADTGSGKLALQGDNPLQWKQSCPHPTK